MGTEGVCYMFFTIWTPNGGPARRAETKEPDAATGPPARGALEAERDAIIAWMEANCKEWAFQLERCPTTNRLHWQAAACLHKKARPATVKTAMRKAGLPNADVRPCSAAGSRRGATFYVQKEATRVEKWGPYHHGTEVIEIPDDLKEIESGAMPLRGWQLALYAYCADTTMIKDLIRIIFDPAGGAGKSTIKRWMVWKEIACVIPAMTEAKDILRFVMNQQQMRRAAKKPYWRSFVFDVPRAMGDEYKAMARFWSAMETLKDGSAYDDRYNGKQIQFCPPRIVVFVNTLGYVGKHLSARRPDICTVADGELATGTDALMLGETTVPIEKEVPGVNGASWFARAP